MPKGSVKCCVCGKGTSKRLFTNSDIYDKGRLRECFQLETERTGFLCPGCKRNFLRYQSNINNSNNALTLKDMDIQLTRKVSCTINYQLTRNVYVLICLLVAVFRELQFSILLMTCWFVY